MPGHQLRDSLVGGFWFFPYQTGSLPGRPSAPVTVPPSPDLGVKCGVDDLNRPLTFTGFAKLKQKNPAWAIVGQGYVVPDGRKTKGDTVKFDYNQTTTKSQTSTLGLGVSGYGVDAGYNGSGTSQSTAKGGQGYPKQTTNTWFRTYFNTALFRGMCVGTNGDTTIHHQKQNGYCPRTYKPMPGFVDYVRKCFWMVKSTGWFGPSANLQHRVHGHLIGAPHTPNKFCGPEPGGATVPTAKQEAVQWSAGFDIGAADKIKDVTLKASFGSSTQTGYDANAQMLFTFGHAGFICGTNGDTGRAAQLHHMSSRPPPAMRRCAY